MTDALHYIDQDRCRNLEAGLNLEWLVTNGRGGFAMGTANQALARRYHGLLVAAIDPPVERFVLLAKLDATVTIGEATFDIATNDYVGAVHPHGYRFLESFSSRPYPTWRWRTGDAIIEQTLCMAEGEDTTFVRYRLVDGPRLRISVRPLSTSRHFHMLTCSLDLGAPNVISRGDRLVFQWDGQRPSWSLSHNGTFSPMPDWYYQFFLPTEALRGYDFKQDLFCPGTIEAELRPDDPVGLVFAATTQDRSWRVCDRAFAETGRLHQASITNSGAPDPLLESLTLAARDFLVARGDDLSTVIAGYPWFGDWGRDTFISLPGLCLVPGRIDDARKIILAFADHVDAGMIPNRFPDFGEAPAYNTADATLWYVHAIDRYLAYSGDWTFIARRMFPVIADIIQAHERGTRHGIGAGEDGLLAAGKPGLAVTWMDAQLAGRAVTPRIGKPVEINALWYNTLCIAAAYAECLGRTDLASRWKQAADRARVTFNERFWNGATGCLHDVIDVNGEGGTADPAIRPNQLLAISLTHPVLEASRWKDVVAVCERQLLTPMGLRTLSPLDPAYVGRYGGDLASRDNAYHQGTVWPWLIGPFVTAYVKAFGGSQASRSRAGEFLRALTPHINEAGIGSISEVADGDPPHVPGGCPWQAWSVAEPLRALCEDVLATHPPAPREERPACGVACGSSGAST